MLYYSNKLIDEKYDVEEFDSVNKAWSIFVRETQRESAYDHFSRQIITAVAKRKKILQTALTKLDFAADIEERKRVADLKGNLILTNKHKCLSVEGQPSAYDLDLENLRTMTHNTVVIDEYTKLRGKIDPDPMTLMLRLDLDIMKMYMSKKNEVPSSRHSKVIIRNTNTQT